MSLEKLLDEQIKNAIAEGKFDNLKGAGKPLNLDDYFATPGDIRAGYTLLKNNDFVPQEIELLKEIGTLREKIKNCSDEAEKKALNKKFNEKKSGSDDNFGKNQAKEIIKKHISEDIILKKKSCETLNFC